MVQSLDLSQENQHFKGGVMTKPRVVILGAGFGGLTAARELSDHADVTVVDRHNFQTFLPLLYQVASAGLAADHVAHPVRAALRKSGAQFRMGSPITVDHNNKTVKIDSSEVLPFDHLIIALGSATADFGVKGVSEFALGMKSVHEALSIRAEVMRRFEDLCRFQDDTAFTMAVVGGGPTGVEMAGAFAVGTSKCEANGQTGSGARSSVAPRSLSSKMPPEHRGHSG
jgi:NADH dehydrogenase